MSWLVAAIAIYIAVGVGFSTALVVFVVDEDVRHGIPLRRWLLIEAIPLGAFVAAIWPAMLAVSILMLRENEQLREQRQRESQVGVTP